MFHAITVDSFDKNSTMRLIERSEQLRSMNRKHLLAQVPGSLVATLFYEPSTRTRLSFEAAVYRLGGQVITAENALESSSSKKGESLADVFRVVGSYVDAIVIRHHSAIELAESVTYSPVPVVNAGAGSAEHPTQALLDAYTIWRELGRVDELTIAVLGDLKYGRTVHSLLRLMANLGNLRFKLFFPRGFGLPDDVASELRDRGTAIEICDSLVEALRDADVVYQTRIQTERLNAASESCATSDYALTLNHLSLIGKNARIMHPLPRVGEIDPAMDDDHRAAYFRQAANGLYMRMALVEGLLKGELA